MYTKSPRIIKMFLYGLTTVPLRLILVHINYVMRPDTQSATMVDIEHDG